MRSGTRVAVVAFLLVTLHFTLRLGLGFGVGAPDFLTLALLVTVRELRMGPGAALGLFFGVLEDSFSVLAFGGSAVAMALVGALGARTRDLFVGDSFIFVISYLALGKWMRDLLQWLVVGEGVREPFVQVVLVQAPVSAIYLAFVGVFAMLGAGSRWEAAR